MALVAWFLNTYWVALGHHLREEHTQMTHPYDNPFARRTLLKGAAGLSLAGLLGAATACGNSGGGSSSKTLTMLYFGEQSAATELQNRLQPEISKLDPTITFQVSAINGTDWNDFLAKVLTQVAAGTPPDLISVATEGLQLMAQKELAVPLDDYVTKDMADLKKSYFADVHPALIESMMYQGHLWELPDSFNAGNMFYNTKLFEQAGVETPSRIMDAVRFRERRGKVRRPQGCQRFRLGRPPVGELDVVHVRQQRQPAGGGQVRRWGLAVERRVPRRSGCRRAQGRLELGGADRQLGRHGRGAAST